MSAPAIAQPTDTPEQTAPDRAATNRANAQHSTGPRTEEGKQKVRLNSVRHGLYSRFVVLPGEDRAAYEALGAELFERFDPQTPEQRERLHTLQDAEWRLRRVVDIENGLYVLTFYQQLPIIDDAFDFDDPIVRESMISAAAFQANARLFDQLSRQQGRLQRLIDRTERELQELAIIRNKAVHEEAPQPAPPPTGFAPSEFSTLMPTAPEMPKFTGPLADIKRKQWLRQQPKLPQMA